MSRLHLNSKMLVTPANNIIHEFQIEITAETPVTISRNEKLIQLQAIPQVLI